MSLTYAYTPRSIFEDLSDLPGAVNKFFGLTGDIGQDATQGLQDAVTSGKSPFLEGGDYSITGNIEIPDPVLVECFGRSFRSAEGVTDGKENPHVPGSQCRFFMQDEAAGFTVRAPIIWLGGCFDFTQRASPVTNKVFYIPMDWLGGEYGGRIWDVSMFGSEAVMESNDTDGAFLVYVDFENQTVDGARLENWKFLLKSRHCHTNFHVTPYNPGYNQQSRLHHVRSATNKTYRAVNDAVSD